MRVFLVVLLIAVCQCRLLSRSGYCQAQPHFLGCSISSKSRRIATVAFRKALATLYGLYRRHPSVIGDRQSSHFSHRLPHNPLQIPV
jgi:hypothetical protein